jgi:hypothetical protein
MDYALRIKGIEGAYGATSRLLQSISVARESSSHAHPARLGYRKEAAAGEFRLYSSKGNAAAKPE